MRLRTEGWGTPTSGEQSLTQNWPRRHGNSRQNGRRGHSKGDLKGALDSCTKCLCSPRGRVGMYREDSPMKRAWVTAGFVEPRRRKASLKGV